MSQINHFYVFCGKSRSIMNLSFSKKMEWKSWKKFLKKWLFFSHSRCKGCRPPIAHLTPFNTQTHQEKLLGPCAKTNAFINIRYDFYGLYAVIDVDTYKQ